MARGASRSNVRALSFFTIEEGKIVRIVEFWPEPYPAPESRKHLVEQSVKERNHV